MLVAYELLEPKWANNQQSDSLEVLIIGVFTDLGGLVVVRAHQ